MTRNLAADALAAAIEHLRAKEDALSEAMGEVERRAAQMARQPRIDAPEVIWNAERARIAAILRAFYHAPLSMSSVSPILDLAVELNPGVLLPSSWQAFVKEPK